MTQSKVDAPQVLVNLMTRDDYGGPDADPSYPLTRHSLDKGGVPVTRLFTVKLLTIKRDPDLKVWSLAFVLFI